MASYYDYFGDPIGQIRPTINIYAVDDDGEVPIRQLSCVLTPTEGAMEIARGRQGERGPQGEPAAPYIDQGDIANQATINTLVLGTADKGKAWRNRATNALHYWDGRKWIVHANAYGAPGQAGAMGALTGVSVTMVDEDEPAEGEITGSPGSQGIELRIPVTRGEKGDVGPAAAISVATDFDLAQRPPQTGDNIVMLPSGKWGAGVAGRVVGPYSFGPSEIISVPSTLDASRLIASMELPALPFDTILDISGVVRVQGVSGSTVGIDVRLGNVDTGPIVAKGLAVAGSGERLCQIQNWYATSYGPDNNSAIRIPANHTGTRGTLYVIAKRATGLTQWMANNQDAQLVVRRLPVTG